MRDWICNQSLKQPTVGYILHNITHSAREPWISASDIILNHPNHTAKQPKAYPNNHWLHPWITSSRPIGYYGNQAHVAQSRRYEPRLSQCWMRVSTHQWGMIGGEREVRNQGGGRGYREAWRGLVWKYNRFGKEIFVYQGMSWRWKERLGNWMRMAG